MPYLLPYNPIQPPRVGLIHRPRPTTLLLLGWNVLMFSWLVARAVSAGMSTHRVNVRLRRYGLE